MQFTDIVCGTLPLANTRKLSPRFSEWNGHEGSINRIEHESADLKALPVLCVADGLSGQLNSRVTSCLVSAYPQDLVVGTGAEPTRGSICTIDWDGCARREPRSMPPAEASPLGVPESSFLCPKL